MVIKNLLFYIPTSILFVTLQKERERGGGNRGAEGQGGRGAEGQRGRGEKN